MLYDAFHSFFLTFYFKTCDFVKIIIIYIILHRIQRFCKYILFGDCSITWITMSRIFISTFIAQTRIALFVSVTSKRTLWKIASARFHKRTAEKYFFNNAHLFLLMLDNWAMWQIYGWIIGLYATGRKNLMEFLLAKERKLLTHSLINYY